MAISENWARLLDPGIRRIFEQQREALAAQSVIPAVFSVQSSSKSTEYDLGVGGMGDFEEYDGRIEYDDPEQLWRPSYEHVEYVKAFKVERKLYDDDLYNIINKRPAAFALSAMRTREKHAASVFNNAFDSNYAGFDDVELCDASHPYSPSNTSSTQSNILTAELTYDNLVTARQTMRTFTDDKGELIPINPRLLLVPPELESAANEIINTMRGGNSQQPDTANYAANLAQDRGIRYIVWDYLTDDNAWFLIDPDLAGLYLNWFNRVPLEIAMDPTSDFHLEARWRGYMRYSYGYSDWRFVIGSNPS